MKLMYFNNQRSATGHEHKTPRPKARGPRPMAELLNALALFLPLVSCGGDTDTETSKGNRDGGAQHEMDSKPSDNKCRWVVLAEESTIVALDETAYLFVNERAGFSRLAATLIEVGSLLSVPEDPEGRSERARFRIIAYDIAGVRLSQLTYDVNRNEGFIIVPLNRPGREPREEAHIRLLDAMTSDGVYFDSTEITAQLKRWECE